MTTIALKQLLDSCFTAKRVIETLPELPPGMKPRHIHVLEAVHALQEQNGACRVSDVSARLNVTLPSVTKLVQELENRNLLEKRADSRMAASSCSASRRTATPAFAAMSRTCTQTGAPLFQTSPTSRQRKRFTS